MFFSSEIRDRIIKTHKKKLIFIFIHLIKESRINRKIELIDKDKITKDFFFFKEIKIMRNSYCHF